MKTEDLFLYISSNIEEIFYNLNNVFGITKEEFKLLIENLDDAFNYNNYLNNRNYSTSIFSMDNLNDLKNIFMNFFLKEEEIKKIIIKSPIIILYSNKLDSTYYLFKKDKYYGYTVLDNGKNYTYLYNENINSNIISNNYIVQNMLNYYKIDNNHLTDLSPLETEGKIKNYYFKKKNNKLH